ncbi:winged helix-turn-helix transcriptional regulator [Natronolimnobius baerhuensis]|nr:winged helix-turn-helix transcriptional regulator [Natronolimnobius baerhuensis]
MESKSSTSTTSGRVTKHGGSVPRAVLHKKILDTAESRPDASMEAIADGVSGATVSIVEQVLEEYGDPGAQAAVSDDGAASAGDEPASDGDGSSDEDAAVDDSDSSIFREDSSSAPTVTEPTDEPETGDESAVDAEAGAVDPAESDGDGQDDSLEPADVTEKQRETLRAIARQPTATQATLADQLGVTSATISQRVNSIEGFDWSNRRAFVATVFDEVPLEEADETDQELEQADESGPNLEIGEETDQDHADAEAGDQSVTDETDADSGCDPRGPEHERDTTGDDDPMRSTDTHETLADDAVEPTLEALEALTEQVEALETRLEGLEERSLTPETESEPARETATGVLSDPELTHKVLHACFQAENISEEEELQLLKEATGAGTNAD